LEKRREIELYSESSEEKDRVIKAGNAAILMRSMSESEVHELLVVISVTTNLGKLSEIIMN
jgi:hypothetical protein